MNGKIRLAFLSLIILQAIHSAEEFIFKFYEKFPPMRLIYREAPNLAKPAFAISNVLLFCAGMFCLYYWVRPARRGAKTVIWVWIIIESFNVIAHFVWAVLIRGYNPGAATVILFVPVLIYLSYCVSRVSTQSVAAQLAEPDRS
jgi:glycopeptide antibiotics resistance protein